MKSSFSFVGASVLALLIASPALADDSASVNSSTPASAPSSGTNTAGNSNAFLNALTNGTPLLDMRYRYEDVHQDKLAHDEGAAHTLRTRLGYETGSFENFKARVQVENMLPLNGDKDYNNGLNGLTTYPTIADPRQAIDLYEANLSYQGVPQSTFTVGRQVINLDNQRWIGAVDWRQLGQTFDALSAQNKSIKDLDLSYSYIFHVNRIYGPSAGSATTNSYDSSAHAIHAAYTGVPGVKLIGYSYLLDLHNAATLSSQTYGTRLEAKHKVVDGVNALLNGEYARQMGFANNPVHFGYNYYLAEPGLEVWRLTGKVGYESMGGDGNHALQTPLDTGHAFNGWAEKFLTTPAGGLDNVHVALEYTSPSYNDWLDATSLKATWYNFSADANSRNYGHEYDLWAGQTFYKHYTVGLEYAQFLADNTAYTDTRKIVAQLQVKF